MNLKQFSEKLLNKWPYKLLCLGLAVVVYIIHSSMEYDTKTFTIPITVVEEGAVLNLDTSVQTVQLRIRSDTETIASIHESDFKATVNLNNIAVTGEYQLPINVAISDKLDDNLVFEVKQKPQSIKVAVEKKDIAYIKLVPSFVGDPAHGYEIDKYTIEPEYVEVVGPETVLKSTKEVKTEKIDLTDIKNDFTVEVKNRNLNSVLQLNDKGPYTVKVQMAASKMDRSFEKVPINFRGLNSNFVLIGDYPDVGFVLNGAINSLETYELLPSAAYVDLSSIKEAGTFELPLQLTLPGYYSVVSKSTEMVTVTVEQVQPIEVAPAVAETEVVNEE